MSEEKKKINTYLGLAFQSEDETIANSLEIDLITSRQRGEEVRFLAVTVMTKTSDMEHPEEVSINLDRESFDKLKLFFNQIEWNS